MSLVSVEIQIGQSEKDVCDVIGSLISALKAKKPLAEILTAEIPALITIATEFQNLGSEYAASDKAVIAAYLAIVVEKSLA